MPHHSTSMTRTLIPGRGVDFQSCREGSSANWKCWTSSRKNCSSNHCREFNGAITLRRDDQQTKQDRCCSNGPKPIAIRAPSRPLFCQSGKLRTTRRHFDCPFFPDVQEPAIVKQEKCRQNLQENPSSSWECQRLFVMDQSSTGRASAWSAEPPTDIVWHTVCSYRPTTSSKEVSHAH